MQTYEMHLQTNNKNYNHNNNNNNNDKLSVYKWYFRNALPQNTFIHEQLQ